MEKINIEISNDFINSRKRKEYKAKFFVAKYNINQ